MHEVRAEPVDHRTGSAGLEAGEAYPRTSPSPQLPGTIRVGRWGWGGGGLGGLPAKYRGLGRQGVGQGFVDRTASLAIKAE